MKKIQLPAIGGIRKVIQPGANVTAGTTIAEVGSQVITLAQLAAAITNLQGQQQNSGGGNIVGPTTPGSGNAGTLVPGPGLSGGGVLVGNVPIRLTAPIPWSDDSGGGGDGDPGPPGAAGAAGAAGANGAPGAQGPAGAAIFLEAEPGDDGLWAIPGPQGQAGAVGATGPQGPQGPSGSGTGGGTGTLMMWVPEENWPDDPIARMPSSVGYLTVQGNLSVAAAGPSVSGGIVSTAAIIMGAGGGGANTGSIMLYNNATGLFTLAATSFQLEVGTAAAIAANNFAAVTVGPPNANSTTALTVQAKNTAGLTQGLLVQSGTTSTDSNSKFASANGATIFGQIMGDGGIIWGTIAAGHPLDKGPGSINITGNYFINDVPIQNAFGLSVSPYLLLDGDNYNDDQGFMRPIPTNAGPLTVNGPMVISNGVSITRPLLVVAAGANAGFSDSTNTGEVFVNGGGIGFGSVNNIPTYLFVNNGAPVLTVNTNSSVTISASPGGTPLLLTDGTINAQVQLGASSLQIGTVTNNRALIFVNNSTQLSITSNTAVFTSAVGLQGPTPTVTAGQTDIGISTTATVITTAGGIALPALASTFWRVNVNGVAYGIPCFAL